ncbi:TIGR03086 family metal-binding protein [Kitasatospora sp. NPDC048365]|uniref:TIGR03086 family metal-binding protein n=1 Tax=Kitasatospora sp. NPDC048365 TaxID=3364050 RepID=UPI00371DFEDF
MDATSFDPRPNYLRALDQLEKLLQQVTPEQLDRATPCSEYTLRELLSHTVGGVHRIAYVGEGGHSQDVPAATGEVGDGEWAATLGRARERAVAAWADDTKLDRPSAVPWGTVPGRFALGGYIMEAVTHTWDIAQVVAPATAFDDELALGALAIAQQVLPADQRDENVPFGPVRPAPADATPTTRLAAWLGRTVS